MAITGYKIVQADTPDALAALLDAEILAGNSPIGAPGALLTSEYPILFTLSQAIAVGVDTVTDYAVIRADTTAAMGTAVTTAIGGGWKLLGGVIVGPRGNDPRFGVYMQAVYKGTPADAGYSGSGTAVPAHVHAGADITSGTVALARLPLADGGTAGVVRQGSGTIISEGTISVP